MDNAGLEYFPVVLKNAITTKLWTEKHEGKVQQKNEEGDNSRCALLSWLLEK